MITEGLLADAIRQVAADSPQHKMIFALGDPCSYLPDRNNARGCLVGEALRKLGVPVSVLTELDSAGGGAGWGSIQHLDSRLAEYLAPDALSSLWVSTVQLNQDCGEPWLEAVWSADARVGVPAG